MTLKLSPSTMHHIWCLSTDTIDFIAPSLVPTDHKNMYVSFVCDHHSLKTEELRVRSVLGGDKLHYDANTGSPVSNMVEKNTHQQYNFRR